MGAARRRAAHRGDAAACEALPDHRPDRSSAPSARLRRRHGKDGIPVTSPFRTLVDLAVHSERGGVEALINQADKLDLIDPVSLRAGLPKPRTQAYLNGFRVDFHWPELGLVFETDGLRNHRTPAQQARQTLRDNAHATAGLTPLRFTHAQVCYAAAYVENTLRDTARRLLREGLRSARS